MIRSLFARAGELAPRVLGCVRNAALAAGLVLAPALAQAAFTVTPLTWNVVGLDSNSPASGPRHFPVGARVCTTTAATGINVSFAWTTANANVNLRPGTLSAIPIASLAAGACSDAYFEVEVTPVAAAYDTTRRYVITAADSVNSATSPTPRELYVEHLISQSRNSITDIKLDGVSVPPGGSMNLVVGQTYSIELDGGTATQGYNQFEAFINIPNTIFQVLAVSTTYSADNSPYVPNPNDKLYADACLWDNNPGSPNYRSCAGDFKAGGSDVRTTYTVRIVGGGGSQQSINSLLYDFSGSSYHYNADYGVGARIANIIDPASLTFAKAFTPSPAVAGGTSTLTFTITNPNAGAIAGVSFSDPLPLLSGSQMVVATPATFSTSNCGTPTFAPTAGASTVSISNATVPANGACVVNVRVFIPSLPATGTYANVSNNLFVGALDTGKTASANLALTSFAPPSGSCGLVLAQWTMAAAAPTTVPPAFSTKAADVTTATAAAGAGITSAISTTIGNPVNSWGASGWSNAAVLSTSSNDYFEFAATTTNYTSITFSFDAQRTVAPQYGPQSLQLHYSTDGTNFTAYGSAIATGTSWATVSVPFTGTANASGLTYFRIYGYDAANSGTNPQLFIDNITIGGCQTTQPATLTKSFSPNPIAVGGTSTLTFTLANPNATSLTGVRFTDALPAGLQVAASPGASTTCGGSPTWAPAGGATSLTFGSPTGATIGGGSSCTVTVNVTATTSGPHTNVSGFAASTEGGTNTGGTGSAVASLTAILPPVLAKDFGASPLLAGGTSLLTITLTNPNVNDALSGVAFSDTYPAGLVNVNPLTPAVGNTCGGTVTAAAGGNGVSLASGTLGAGASCTVTVTVTSAAAGAYLNTTGNVSAATAGTGNSDSATLTVVNPTPAISLNKQVGTSATGPWLKFVTVAPGTPLFYRFTVENVGDVAFNPFNVSDPTLAGTAVDPATCVWQTPNVPSTLPALPVATATIDPTATCVLGPVTAGNGDFPNTATAHGTFSGTQYNSESSTAEYIGAPPGFSLLKQISTVVDGPWSSAINVSAGTSVFYRFLLVNTGALPLTAINVTDPLVSTAGCAFTDPLAVGASTLCVAGPVTAAGGNGSTTTNTATGHGTNGATVYDTAISSASYTIGSASADLAVTKTVDNATPNVGSNVTFTVTVTNNGPSTAAGVSVADALPAGYSFVSATPSVGTYSSGTWTIGAMANGASATLSITGTVQASGAYANTATASTTTTDPNSGNNSATSTPVPVAQADLAVTKNVDNATPGVGSNVTFTVTVTNNGPSAAAGVSVSDALPAGYSFVSATPSVGSYSSGTWTLGALANGASATLSITATVQATGPYANTATVSATTTDPNSGNNSATSTPVPVAQADLAVTKIVDNATPNVGSNVTFTVTVTNNGPNDAAGVSVADALPAGYALVSATPSTGTYSSGTWTIGALANGASATLSITATVLASGSYANTATASATTNDPNGGNNSATSTPVPVAQADLAVTKIVDNGTPIVGTNVTFTVTVTNNGPSAAAGVSVADALPAGYSFVSATPSVGSYSSGTWTIGALANSASATLSITATVQASGPYTNTATVSATTTDPNGSNNSASSTPTPGVQADLAVTKTVDNATPNVGSNVTFTVTVTNNGPNAAAGVSVADALPAGYSFVSATPSVGSYSSGTWTIGALANGASVTLSITATVQASGPYANTATVSASTTDPNGGNNSATSTPVPVAQADLAVTKTVDNTSPSVGNNVTFTVTVTNNGPSAAAGVSVADALPAGYSFVSATPSVGSYSSGTWTIGAMANGANATLAITATVQASGPYTNTATVSATSTDPNSGNNSASSTPSVGGTADLSITKTNGVTSLVAGGPVTYTIVALNAGPSAVTGATVADTLPGTITGATWTCSGSGGGTCPASGNGSINAAADLPVGASVTFILTGTVASSATGSLSNTATIAAPSGVTDPNTNNNSANDTDPVQVQVALAVVKTDGSASYTPGGTATYTVTVTNTGPSLAANLTLADTLPAGVTLTANVNCVAAGNASCGTVTGLNGQSSFGTTGATLGAAAADSLTFTAPVAFAANLTANPLVNQASATDVATGANAQGTDSNTLASQVALSVVKTDGSASYTPGGTATYTVTVANGGVSNATNVTVTDSLPAGVTLTGTVTCTANGAASCGAVTGTSGQSAFGATGAQLGAGAGNSIVFTVPVAFAASLATTPLVNTAQATDVASGATGSGSDSNARAPAVTLAVTKSDGSATYVPGGSATYTIVVTSTGLSDALDVSVSDSLPAGVTLSANASCVAAGLALCGTVTGTTGQTSFGATGAAIAAGAGNSLTFTVPVTFAANLADNPLINAATANDTLSGASATGSDSNALAAQAGLAVTKSDGSATYTPGGTATYAIVVTNSGPSNAASVTVSDSLPAGATLSGSVTCTPAGTATCGTVTGTTGQTTLGTTGATIAAGAGNSLTFSAPVAFAAGLSTNPLVNTVTVTDPAAPTPVNASDSNALASQVSLAVAKTDGSATYTPGGTATYAVTVTNGGVSNAANVTVGDTLPAGVTLTGNVTCVASGGAACGTITGSAGQSSFGATGAQVPAGGASLVYTVPVAFAAGMTTDPLVNTATASDVPTGSTASGSDSDARAAVNADLAISKTDNAASVAPGAVIIYTIVASNAGPGAVIGAAVTDNVPASLSGVTWTCAASAGSACPASGSGAINAPVNLLVGGTATFTLSGTLSASATGTLTNTATIAPPAGVTDPNLGNNSATDVDTIVVAAAVADLAITKTDNATSVAPGTAVTYTIVASNAGPNTVSGATVTDNVPASLTGVTWTCAASAGSSCPAAGSGSISATVNLLVGGTAAFTLSGTLSASATGTLTNTAAIASPAGVTDPNLGNNSATDVDTIVAPATTADLAILKTGDATSLSAGGVVTYTIVVTNNGPAAVVGATVTDTMPPGLVNVTWTCTASAGSACPAAGAGDINAVVNLLAGGTATFTVVGTVSTGSLDNTATVAAPPGVVDPNAANNSSTVLAPSVTVFGAKVDLAIVKQNVGPFSLGQVGAQYTIVVSNVGTVPTSGTVTVTDVLPPGLTAVSIGGTGWNCAQPAGPCTRADVLAPGASWPPIVLTVNIAPDAPSPIENTALVVGGGDANGANNSAKNVVNLQPTQPAATVEAIPVNDPLALALAALLMLMAGGYRLARRR